MCVGRCGIAFFADPAQIKSPSGNPKIGWPDGLLFIFIRWCRPATGLYSLAAKDLFAVFFAEFVNAASGVNNALFTCIKRMA